MPTGSGVPTEVTNFTWSAFFGLLLTIINGTAVGVWLKTRPNMRKLEIDADKALIDQLMARLEKVERTLEEERARHAAERAVNRHQLANVTQCLDALLMLLKQDPTKAAEAITMIEEMRARQREAEALEKAAIHAAMIAAAAGKPPPTTPTL